MLGWRRMNEGRLSSLPVYSRRPDGPDPPLKPGSNYLPVFKGGVTQNRVHVFVVLGMSVHLYRKRLHELHVDAFRCEEAFIPGYNQGRLKTAPEVSLITFFITQVLRQKSGAIGQKP